MARTTLFLMLAALVAVGAATPALAQDDPKKEEPPSLQVGDPAPTLKVTRWLQGDPVMKFEPGKVYVVEFWATWCGACIRQMPHVADLQARYKDKGVTVISFTCRDFRGTDNSEE